MIRNIDKTPFMWDCLSVVDQYKYNILKESLNPGTQKFKYAQLCQYIRKSIEKIKDFVIEFDGNDWVRSMVCGIIWLENGILAINTSQLTYLIPKNRNIINEGFQAIGLIARDKKIDVSQYNDQIQLTFKANLDFFKKWTVRYYPHTKIEKLTPESPVSPVSKTPLCDALALSQKQYLEELSAAGNMILPPLNIDETIHSTDDVITNLQLPESLIDDIDLEYLENNSYFNEPTLFDKSQQDFSFPSSLESSIIFQ